VLRVPFVRLPSWPELRGALAGFTVLALAPRPPAVPLSTVDPFAPRLALLLGAEGPGLTAEALAAADTNVRIPMAAGVDSLNVATAAAIALYCLRLDE
jgi:tRNA G18 (ribose-2'-O)-methylase SpoU